MSYRPIVLAVLDGWGCRDEQHGNAIANATIPHWNSLFSRYPWTTLHASGEHVGLPAGVVGNSEVGHLNLGTGRVVPQGVTVIDGDIAAGLLPHNETLLAAIEHVRKSGGTLHIMGLLSDGQVHSSITHTFALIDAVVAAGVPMAIHVFPDGRDTPPTSSPKYVAMLQAHLDKAGRPDAIATVIGRFFSLDRDKRWDRTKRAYDTLMHGVADRHVPDAATAIREGHAAGETDEFILPAIVGQTRTIEDGDAVIFTNFRPDRARQIMTVLNAGTSIYHHDAFDAFALKQFANPFFATMTKYDEASTNPVLFGPRPQYDTFGDVLSQHGLHQLRLAETEKYAHVTYFFNGGREDVLEGEDRTLIPSDRTVATYDLAPPMRAREITDAAIAGVESGKYDAIVINYANADMLGHTGKFEPTIRGVEVLDECLERLARATLAAGGILALTADHGNAEYKIDADGNPLTSHTTNPVPFVLVGDGLTGTLEGGGKLGDVAPTLLTIMGLPVPDAMNGRNLYTIAQVSSAPATP